MGVISMAMTMAIKGFFDGIGRTQVHLVAAIVMNVFNVLFCYCFIFGHLGAPRLGVTGAGVSGFLATWIGLFIMVAYAAQLRSQFHPGRWSNISRGLTWDILKLSIPAAVATAVMMFGFGLFTRIVGKLDAADTSVVPGQCGASEAVFSAATTDIVEILKLTFTACIAFGTATATLVGQSLGAKRPDDAEKFGWASVRLGLVIFGVVGLCEGLLFTPQIVHFISQSEAVRDAAMIPMRMMGVDHAGAGRGADPERGALRRGQSAVRGGGAARADFRVSAPRGVRARDRREDEPDRDLDGGVRVRGARGRHDEHEVQGGRVEGDTPVGGPTAARCTRISSGSPTRDG